MCPTPSRHRFAVVRVLLALSPLLMLACSGCEALGIASEAVSSEVNVKPAYAGFKAQKVAVLVWADEGISVDHPRIIAEVAEGLRDKLQQAVDAKVDEFKGTTFLEASTVLRFQDAHPESASDPAEQVALQFPISRLIYVEIQSLSLHPGESTDLSKGQAVADVKVVEVANGKSTVAYASENVSAIYPSDAPPEGLPGLSEDTVYAKTIDALTTEVAKLFIPHPSEDSEKNDFDNHQ